ncbi:MAG: response regulator transcription factor [Acidobacteriaceae bacterium]|nr:response regulator transcription factor [Acidobacteriaceae bacterium]
MVAKILILDEDASANSFLGMVLQRENFLAILVDSREALIRDVYTTDPDLLILNAPLGGMGSVEMCMELRKNQIHKPLMILSDRADEIDKVLALEAGADDYIVKPLAIRELVARARALLRRRKGNLEATIRFGNVEVDRERRTVMCRGQEVRVTPIEYKLLLFFLANVDLALTRQTLLTSIWGYSERTNTRTLDEHICKLRTKFELDPSAPRHFVTIHGIGYRFLM